MASLTGTHLNREWISSAPLRPNRAFCWEQGIVTNHPGLWTHWTFQTALPWKCYENHCHGEGEGGKLLDVSYPQYCYSRASPGCQVRSRCSRAPRRPSHWVGGAVRHCARCAPAPHIPRLHSLEVELVAIPVSNTLHLAVAHQAGGARTWRQNTKRQRQQRRSHDSRAVSPQEPS